MIIDSLTKQWDLRTVLSSCPGLLKLASTRLTFRHEKLSNTPNKSARFLSVCVQSCAFAFLFSIFCFKIWNHNVSLHETSFHQKHRNEGSVESASFFTTSTFSRSSSSIKQACEIWKSHPNLTKQAWQCFGQSWRAESFAFSPPFSYLLSALLKFQRARVKWTNLKAWRFYVRPFLLWVYSTDTF